MDFLINIDSYFKDLKSTIDKIDLEQINVLINRILNAYERNGTIYVFGNGGSASVASHFMVDFNKGLSEKLDKKFRFICLNDNIPCITAISNDIGYDKVFKTQLENFLNPNDLVIGISGSGNSECIVQAIEYAKSKGVETLALVGFDGGRLKSIADYHIHSPINDMQIVEDISNVLNHLMMKAIKNYLEKGKVYYDCQSNAV